MSSGIGAHVGVHKLGLMGRDGGTTGERRACTGRTTGA